MTTFEMVEKLRQRANVSYNEAKEALDMCNGDLLEAMILLEKQGKAVPPDGGGYYSTWQGQEDYNGEAGSYTYYERRRGVGLGQMLRRFGRWLRGILRKGNRSRFETWRGEERLVSIPVTVFVLVIICCFWVFVPLMIIGLFFGCRYKFGGQVPEKVNEVMDSAARMAESVKNEFLKPGEDHEQY